MDCQTPDLSMLIKTFNDLVPLFADTTSQELRHTIDQTKNLFARVDIALRHATLDDPSPTVLHIGPQFSCQIPQDILTIILLTQARADVATITANIHKLRNAILDISLS